MLKLYRILQVSILIGFHLQFSTAFQKPNVAMNVVCNGKFIHIRATFNYPFAGIVYTRPNRNSCVAAGVGDPSVSLFIPLAEPGVTDCGVALVNGVYMAVVDVNWHSTIETAYDNSFLVQCSLGQKTTQGLVTETFLPDMQLLSGGKPVKELIFGSQYTVKIEHESGFHKIIKCMAFGGESHEVKYVSLLDNHGCPVDDILSPFATFDDSPDLSQAKLSMFRFNSTYRFHLQCAVLRCGNHPCPQVNCKNGQNFGGTESTAELLVSARLVVQDERRAERLTSTSTCSFSDEPMLVFLSFLLAILILLFVMTCSCAVQNCPFKLKINLREEEVKGAVETNLDPLQMAVVPFKLPPNPYQLPLKRHSPAALRIEPILSGENSAYNSTLNRPIVTLPNSSQVSPESSEVSAKSAKGAQMEIAIIEASLDSILNLNTKTSSETTSDEINKPTVEKHVGFNDSPTLKQPTIHYDSPKPKNKSEKSLNNSTVKTYKTVKPILKHPANNSEVHFEIDLDKFTPEKTVNFNNKYTIEDSKSSTLSSTKCAKSTTAYGENVNWDMSESYFKTFSTETKQTDLLANKPDVNNPYLTPNCENKKGSGSPESQSISEIYAEIRRGNSKTELFESAENLSFPRPPSNLDQFEFIPTSTYNSNSNLLPNEEEKSKGSKEPEIVVLTEDEWQKTFGQSPIASQNDSIWSRAKGFVLGSTNSLGKTTNLPTRKITRRESFMKAVTSVTSVVSLNKLSSRRSSFKPNS